MPHCDKQEILTDNAVRHNIVQRERDVGSSESSTDGPGSLLATDENVRLRKDNVEGDRGVEPPAEARLERSSAKEKGVKLVEDRTETRVTGRRDSEKVWRVRVHGEGVGGEEIGRREEEWVRVVHGGMRGLVWKKGSSYSERAAGGLSNFAVMVHRCHCMEVCEMTPLRSESNTPLETRVLPRVLVRQAENSVDVLVI